MKHFTRQFTHSSEYAREINQSGPVVRSGTIAADAKERQQPSPEIAALVRFFVQIIHALSHATGATTMPSAPREWGPWPPDQERINLVMRRACKALARQIKDDPRYNGVVLLAEPKGAPTFDCYYGPGTESVTAGSIYGLGSNMGWLVEWFPSTDTGRLSPGRIEHEAFL